MSASKLIPVKNEATAAWLSCALRELRELLKLPRGWDSHDSEPPKANAVAEAESILRKISDSGSLVVPTRLMASAEGGVAIVFLDAHKYADIECLNDGSVLAAISDRKSDPQVWDVQQESLDVTLERIREFLKR